MQLVLYKDYYIQKHITVKKYRNTAGKEFYKL